MTLLGFETRGLGEAAVRMTRRGRCELIFQTDGKRHIFPVALSSLINVGLGARTHLASDFGACTLSRAAGGIKIVVSAWGDVADCYYVPVDMYVEALDDLEKARYAQMKVSLR